MYPPIDQLPCFVETRNWTWKPFEGLSELGADFFEGVDELGAKWLTKMRGSFRGYREIVFERLVQRASWLCQSSTFAILDNSSLPMRNHPGSERIQLVTRVLREHGPEDCKPECPIGPLRGDLSQLYDDPLKALASSPLKGVLNIARAEILAPLLGGTECAGYLTTTDHRVFLIDGELMFLTWPSDVRETYWWNRSDGSPWSAGQQLTRDVCATVGSFEDDELEAILELPEDLEIELNWPLRPLLYCARDYGWAFA